MHTKGPWHASPDWPFQDEQGRLHDAVTVKLPDGTDALICSFEHSVMRNSQNANAKLIAAAPTLLEACKAIADLANGQGRLNLMMVAGQARQAIALAEGEQPTGYTDQF